MAIASVNATAKTIGVWMRLAASGLRPIASIARLAIQPMEKAGMKAPPTMVRATSKFLSSTLATCAAVFATSAGSIGEKWERSEKRRKDGTEALTLKQGRKIL